MLIFVGAHKPLGWYGNIRCNGEEIEIFQQIYSPVFSPGGVQNSPPDRRHSFRRRTQRADAAESLQAVLY